VRAARAFNHSPSGVGAAIATDWIESGRADELAREVRAETAARTKLALAIRVRGVAAQAGDGLRLCLGNAASHAALERALSIVKAAVAGDVEDHRATL
jgi:hypothetical protein